MRPPTPHVETRRTASQPSAPSLCSSLRQFPAEAGCRQSVRNPDHVRGRAAYVVVDGKEIKGTLVRLARAGATVRVEIIVRPEHGRL